MKPMLATKYEPSQVQFPCCVQPKFDGVRCILHEDEGGVIHLTSRGGKEYDVPQIKAWGEAHRNILPLDGEIYNHQELTFQQICSAVKCCSELTGKLRMVIYDAPVSGSFASRWEMLRERFAEVSLDAPVYLSQTFVAHNEKDIERWHKVFVSTGYEGAIIRNSKGLYTDGRSNDLMKLKAFDTTEFEVVDVLEAGGLDAGTAIFKLRVKNYEFCSRPTGTKSLRAQYLADKEELIGKMATVQHQGCSDAGVPRFPVLLNIRDYE